MLSRSVCLGSVEIGPKLVAAFHETHFFCVSALSILGSIGCWGAVVSIGVVCACPSLILVSHHMVTTAQLGSWACIVCWPW